MLTSSFITTDTERNMPAISQRVERDDVVWQEIFSKGFKSINPEEMSVEKANRMLRTEHQISLDFPCEDDEYWTEEQITTDGKRIHILHYNNIEGDKLTRVFRTSDAREREISNLINNKTHFSGRSCSKNCLVSIVR